MTYTIKVNGTPAYTMATEESYAFDLFNYMVTQRLAKSLELMREEESLVKMEYYDHAG